MDSGYFCDRCGHGMASIDTWIYKGRSPLCKDCYDFLVTENSPTGYPEAKGAPTPTHLHRQSEYTHRILSIIDKLVNKL